MDFYEPKEELPNGGPPHPNLLVLDVCFTAVVWTSYLALHYFRKNKSGSGKLVMTSSEAGLYPSGGNPLYASAKAGVREAPMLSLSFSRVRYLLLLPPLMLTRRSLA